LEAPIRRHVTFAIAVAAGLSVSGCVYAPPPPPPPPPYVFNTYDPAQRALAGGLIGAGAGAALGGIVGGGQGAAIGAVAGGALGAAAGASSAPEPPYPGYWDDY